METPESYWPDRSRYPAATPTPKEEPTPSQPDEMVCGSCGREADLVHNLWPLPDLCPDCQVQAEPPARRRHPVPIATLPTKDRLLLQALLQLSAERIVSFHPSEQVGWLNFLLEQLDVEQLAKYKRYTHANYVLQALRREITERLETGRW